MTTLPTPPPSWVYRLLHTTYISTVYRCRFRHLQMTSTNSSTFWTLPDFTCFLKNLTNWLTYGLTHLPIYFITYLQHFKVTERLFAAFRRYLCGPVFVRSYMPPPGVRLGASPPPIKAYQYNKMAANQYIIHCLINNLIISKVTERLVTAFSRHSSL